MKPLISEEYRKLNAELHVSREDFGKRAEVWSPMAMALAARLRTRDILDYGCGKGNLNLAMPFEVKCYDPAFPKYAAPPEPADIVFCLDVLEHIEPEYLDNVVEHLKGLTKKVLVVNIHTGPSKKTLADGRNAHLIQRPSEFWVEKFADMVQNTFHYDDPYLTMVLSFPEEKPEQ